MQLNGMYRVGTDDEQLRLFERFEDAMALRHPVKVTYFREKGVDVVTGRTLYVKTTRMVEPHELTNNKHGDLIVKVVDRSPRKEKRPAYRTIRLDRIAFSRRTGLALMTVKVNEGYLNPTRLDGVDLHPSKGQLTGVSA